MKFVINSTSVHQVAFMAIVQRWMTGQHLFSVSCMADIKINVARYHVFSMVIY